MPKWIVWTSSLILVGASTPAVALSLDICDLFPRLSRCQPSLPGGPIEPAPDHDVEPAPETDPEEDVRKLTGRAIDGVETLFERLLR
jgi:hypothetical protein